MYCVIEKEHQQQQLPDIGCLVDPRHVKVYHVKFLVQNFAH